MSTDVTRWKKGMSRRLKHRWLPAGFAWDQTCDYCKTRRLRGGEHRNHAWQYMQASSQRSPRWTSKKPPCLWCPGAPVDPLPYENTKKTLPRVPRNKRKEPTVRLDGVPVGFFWEETP